KEIRDESFGKQIVLSRADPEFVKKLFQREVPEIAAGGVVISNIAREPGVRTKICVMSTQSGVDPVGSCVGQKGVRVQAVTNELNGERIDIIQYTDNVAELIKSAIAPATNVMVSLDEVEKIAYIKVPENQLSLAIGKDGQNARLVAKLSGWKIKIASYDSGEQDGSAKSDADQDVKMTDVYDTEDAELSSMTNDLQLNQKKDPK
ncbi:MAG: transcription termination/antitermination protein NusA, partial [Patescibacteria group bacterium]|nr:transcription termination/antitermination protein NusA [Patescibacteria group bacterium]